MTTVKNLYRSDAGLDDVISPQVLAEERPDLFTPGRIEWFIRQRRSNGLVGAGAIVQVGRRLFIRRSAFVAWFLSCTT